MYLDFEYQNQEKYIKHLKQYLRDFHVCLKKILTTLKHLAVAVSSCDQSKRTGEKNLRRAEESQKGCNFHILKH
jgi:hypothetical protein